MPRRKPSKKSRKPPKGLTRKQSSAVAKIAKQAIMKTTEAKHTLWQLENQQLIHNVPNYHINLMQTSQGLDDNNNTQGSPGGTDIREGDQIYLNNINCKFWLSNKHDRPNVMYRIILFTYDQGDTVNNSLVFFTDTNKMLDRTNFKGITVLKSKYVKSGNSYSPEGKEHSYLTSMNVNYKRPKRMVFQENSSTPKDKNLGVAIVAYDAFGTLQTDNIASYAFDIKLTWRDP